MEMWLTQGSVVVGVDGSASGEAALAWAVRHAVREDRQLTVLHACGLPGVMDDYEDIVASERGLMSVGRSIVRDAVATARAADSTLLVEPVVTMGSPATVLVEASESASVLVVGARGRGAVASALLGSVSAVVTREAYCPVVVVRGWVDSHDRPVVVGVDGTPVSTAAVEFAFRRAAMEHVPLTVLHATRDRRTRTASAGESRSHAARINLSEREERLVAETVAGLCEKYPDVTVTELYRRGDPVNQLVEASRNASLLVVGARGRRTLSAALRGSVSRGVAERAESPVAVVRG
jgi:nucleotide-binding universal stress UspA family protein